MPREWECLQRALQGEKLTTDDLDVLKALPTETLWFDFKNGAGVQNRGFASDLRKDVSAFANVDGGLLLIGIADELVNGSRPVTGIVAPGGKDPQTWCADMIAPLVRFMLPAPKPQTVDHPDGKVVVVAVPRSTVLIPIQRNERTQHCVRFHDGTRRLPEPLAVRGARARCD